MSLRSGFNRGVVTRASGAGVYVQMPDLYGSSEVGPLDYLGPKSTHTHPDAGSSTSTATVFNTGDRVLVASVGPGDWVVLGRIETAAN